MPEFISLAAALLSGWLLVRLILWRAEWLSALARSAVSVVDALLSPLPEAQKLPLVERRNLLLLAALGRFFLLIGLALAAGWAVVQAGDLFPWGQRPRGLLGHWGLFSVGATLPFLRRSKQRGPLQPHPAGVPPLGFGPPQCGTNALSTREVKRVLQEKTAPDQPFLIVTGLARAGTTSLLNHLSETGAFASLNYRHMPFLMAPGTWARWHKPAYVPSTRAEPWRRHCGEPGVQRSPRRVLFQCLRWLCEGSHAERICPLGGACDGLSRPTALWSAPSRAEGAIWPKTTIHSYDTPRFHSISRPCGRWCSFGSPYSTPPAFWTCTSILPRSRRKTPSS